jgi:hypothetical protein
MGGAGLLRDLCDHFRIVVAFQFWGQIISKKKKLLLV